MQIIRVITHTTVANEYEVSVPDSVKDARSWAHNNFDPEDERRVLHVGFDTPYGEEVHSAWFDN